MNQMYNAISNLKLMLPCDVKDLLGSSNTLIVEGAQDIILMPG